MDKFNVWRADETTTDTTDAQLLGRMLYFVSYYDFDDKKFYRLGPYSKLVDAEDAMRMVSRRRDGGENLSRPTLEIGWGRVWW